ncbi:MAG: hypothetical protein ACRCSN_13205 [Dermatophilaceae bacterium]
MIDNPVVARLLVDIGRARYLSPFLGHEATASSGAAQLGITLDHMLSRLRRFTAMGLVTVVRLERRAGRPSKVYRCVADEFFVPLSVLAMQRDTLRSADYWHERYRNNFEAAVAQDLGAHAASGARVYTDRQGRLFVKPAVAPDVDYDEEATDAAAVTYAWGASGCPDRMPRSCSAS